MRKLVLTSRFKRGLRKFMKRDQNLQAQIEETLQQMEADVFAPNLASHQLKGEFDGLRPVDMTVELFSPSKKTLKLMKNWWFF